jgi:hypothetical protein
MFMRVFMSLVTTKESQKKQLFHNISITDFGNF